MADRHIIQFRSQELILPTTTKTALGGEFYGEAYKCRELMDGRSIEIPGTRRRVMGPFDNLITNTGLDHIGNKVSWQSAAQVGTGNAAESITDNTLDTYVAGVGNDGSYDGDGQLTWHSGSNPRYCATQSKYRFQPNFAGGAVNISEVGVGPQTATGNLFCRALVKTGGGVPTTAPVAADEYFDLYYTLRVYPGHCDYVNGTTDDGTGSFDIAGTTYNYTIRAGDIDATVHWAAQARYGFRQFSWNQIYTNMNLYGPDAALGSIYDYMSATLDDAHFYTQGLTVGTYVDSTYTNTIEFDYDLDNGNITGGIKGLNPWSSLGQYQILLDAAIPKDNTKEFHYTHRTSWTRKTL